MTIKARRLLALDQESIWRLRDGSFTLEFDDGCIETNTRDTILSWYCWAVQRTYPNAPLLKRHHISNKRLTTKTLLNLAGDSLWDCFDAYGQDVKMLKPMCIITYKLTNDIYNDFSTRLEEFVNTISFYDFIDIVLHPKIVELRETAKPTVAGIEHSLNEGWKIMTNLSDPAFKNNAVSRSGKSGFTRRGPILQCTMHRGFVTDRDSTIFPKPIMSNYTEGINELPDFAVDSRSATLALSYAKGPLAIVEYFNRKMQLSAGHLRKLTYGDCGSKSYMSWLLRAQDMETAAGKYYLDESTGKLKVLQTYDKHLIGQTLKFRAINHCANHDRNSICSTCFGELAFSMPENVAIGHMSETTMCEEGSQKVLSTKHELGSASANDFVIPMDDLDVIDSGVNESAIYLSSTLPKKNLKLYISGEEASNLNEIFIASDISALPLTRISNLTSIAVLKELPTGDFENRIVVVSKGSRLSSISHELLTYIKARGWTPTTTGSYEIDMSEWDFDNPAFILPMRHLSMVAYLNELESVIKATKRVKKGKGTPTLKNYDNADDAVRALYDLINSKLYLNMAHVEIIVRTTLIRNGATGDYRIPRLGEPYEIASFNERMSHGSAGGAMAYQTQSDVINSPASYIYKNRMPHVLDDLLVP